MVKQPAGGHPGAQRAAASAAAAQHEQELASARLGQRRHPRPWDDAQSPGGL